MKILDFINKKTNNAYKDFKLVSVIFDESAKSCTFKFLYLNDMKDECRDELSKLVSEYINADIDVIIKCKKAYVDNDLVKDVLYNFITKHYASVAVDFDKEFIEVGIDDSINVNVKCSEFQYKYFSSSQIKGEIMAYAEGFFFEPFSIDFELIDGIETKNDVIEDTSFLDLLYSDDNENKIKYVKVENVNNYIGEVNGYPMEISSIKGAMENIEVAGTLKFLTEKCFESKRKDKNGDAVQRVYYSFNVVDKTGKINCVIFPNKADMPKAVGLQEDKIVIVHGDAEEFNGRINLKVKSLGFCDIVQENEEEAEVIIESKPPNDNYLFVKPEPYIEMLQDNLFAVKEEVGKYLFDNDVVVFDIETTGLEANRCEIIEIGAVKISGGRITETFETLIKPTTSIPDEIVELTGITDDMVVNAPNIKQVMPDFYKFCYGTTIIAYNIDFDYKFISIQGKKCGYIFDMKQIDALYLARAFIPGLKNFKLGTVCKKLGVSLENAHRAVHDATATAEVVIKLSPNIT